MPMIRKAKDPDEDVRAAHSQRHAAGQQPRLARQPETRPCRHRGGQRLAANRPQAHFYMETMCALCIPGLYDQMTIYNSTQNPNGDQASSPGRSASKRTKSRSSSSKSVAASAASSIGQQLPVAQAAVAARRLNRPVRLLYDRATDTLMVGKRHPYLGEYHVAATRAKASSRAASRPAVRRRRHLRLFIRRHGPEPAAIGRLLPRGDVAGQWHGVPHQQDKQHGLSHLRQHAALRRPRGCDRARGAPAQPQSLAGECCRKKFAARTCIGPVSSMAPRSSTGLTLGKT